MTPDSGKKKKLGINWRRTGQTLKNFGEAAIKGEVLLRMKFDKYFMHILWFFCLIIFMVWANYMIEDTLIEVQKNKVRIENLRIMAGQTTCELEKMKRISTVGKMLEEKGSSLGIPEKPAATVED